MKSSSREFLVKVIDKPGIRILILIVAALLTRVAGAGEYFLIDMDDRFDDAPRELCPLLVKNFNRFSSEPPMVCVRKFSQDLHEISFPDWESVDISSSLEIVKRLIQEESAQPGFFHTFVKFSESGRFQLWKSRFDFNSDGKENTVYRVTSRKFDGQCKDSNNHQGLSENAKQIFYLVEQNQPNDTQSGFWNVNARVFGDVFLYRMQPYFHRWQEDASIQSSRAKSYEWPFPRIVIRKGVSQFTHRESFFGKPVCEIGYRVN